MSIRPLNTVALALAIATTAATPAIAANTPKPATQAGIAPPTVAQLKLPHSGATLYALRDGRLPRVWWHLYLEAGERTVPAPLAGLTSVAAEVLEQGPATMSLADYRKTLFRMNAEIHWEATNRFLVAHVKCAPPHLEKLAALVKQTALSPRLADGKYALARERVLTARRAMDDDMRQVTFTYTRQRLWNFRREARLASGWPSSIAALRETDMASWLAFFMKRPAAFIAAAGPVSAVQLAGNIGPGLGDWLAPYQAVRDTRPALPTARRAVLIDKPGATDNQIYMLTPLPFKLGSPEADAAAVYFAGMGRDLGARLGELRVKRGLTYGANAGLRATEWPSWYAYTFGGIEQTPKLVAGVREIFAASASGLTAKEVATAQSQLIQDATGDLETPPEQIAAVAGVVALGLPVRDAFNLAGRLARVPVAAGAKPPAGAATLERALIVVMGDASKLKAPLEEALPPGTQLEVKTLAQVEREALSGP